MRTWSPGCAPARASARSTPSRLQPAVGLVEGVVAGEVGQVDGPHGLAPLDHPAAALPGHACSPRRRGGGRRTGSGSGTRGPGPPDRLGQAPAQLRDAGAGHGRDPQVELGPPASSTAVSSGGQVGPAAHDDPVAVEQLGLVGAELVEQDVELLGRRTARRSAPGRAGRTGPGPARCGAGTGGRGPRPSLAPSIRPGDVGHDELGAVVEAHDAEVGLERGERVVGDLGLGGRDAR